MVVSAINNPFEVYNIQRTRYENNRVMRSEEKKDYLALSSKAVDYNMCLKALKNIPDIRESKVQDIGNRIASGVYNVSMDELCDEILSSYDELV